MNKTELIELSTNKVVKYLYFLRKRMEEAALYDRRECFYSIGGLATQEEKDAVIIDVNTIKTTLENEEFTVKIIQKIESIVITVSW